MDKVIKHYSPVSDNIPHAWYVNGEFIGSNIETRDLIQNVYSNDHVLPDGSICTDLAAVERNGIEKRIAYANERLTAAKKEIENRLAELETLYGKLS